MPARVEIQIATTGGKEAEDVFSRIGRAINDSINPSLRKLIEIAGGISIAHIFETATRATVDLGKELVHLGLEVQRQEDAFRRLTASVGVNGAALQAQLEQASRGIADISDVLTTSAQALQEGLTQNQLVTFMTIATEQSKLMGTTVADAFNQITTATLRQQERGLKTAGIYLDLTTVFADYAARLGVTADRLTEYAKTQAIAEAVAAKAKGTVDALSSSTLTNAQAVEKLQTAIKNAKETAGSNFVDLLAASVRAALPWVESLASGFTTMARALDAAGLSVANLLRQAALPGFAAMGQQLSGAINANRVRALGDAIAEGESGAGAVSAAQLDRMAHPPALVKPPDAKAFQQAADALAAFQEKLLQLQTDDETTRKLQEINAEVAKAAQQFKDFPDIVAKFRSIGAEMATVTIALRDKAALEGAQAGWVAYAEAILAGDEANAKVEESINDAARALRDQTTALIDAGWVAHAEAVLADTEASQKAEVQINDTARALRAQEAGLDIASAKFKILGSDFDFVGARASFLGGQLDKLLAATNGEITPAVEELGAQVRAALADQKLYSDIQSGFLSITDTFTKMADGLIQGTLDIADAFKNLGQSLLTNFVQLVLHQVFDPILKEAASFVSGLIGLLTGRGGLVTAGASAFGGLLGALGGAGAAGAGDWSDWSAAGPIGGSGGGGNSTLSTLGTIGGALSSLYSVVAKVADLPTLLDLTATGLTSLGEALGILTTEVSTAGTAAGVVGIGASGGGAAAAGGGVGLAGLGALAGPAAVLSIPALIGFFDTLGRSQSVYNSAQRQSAQGSLGSDQARRMADFASGLIDINNEAFRQDLAAALANVEGTVGGYKGTLGGGEAGATLRMLQESGGLTEQAAKELQAAADQWDTEARDFARTVEALGITPLQGGIDIGQGARGGFGAGQMPSFYLPIMAQLMGAQRGATAAPAFDREAVIKELMADLPRIALILDLPALAKEGEATADTFKRMVAALSGLDQVMTSLDIKVHTLRGDLNVPAVLADQITKLVGAITAAQVELETTQDPEKILAAAQQLQTLIEQRYQLEIDAVTTLVQLLEGQADSLASGFRALAQASSTLRVLGASVRSMTPVVADLVRYLGQVGDTAGQVGLLGAQVATFVADTTGATADTILSLGGALAGSLSDTLANVNQMTDAQARMAALTEVLGAVTQGYEAGAAALDAFYNTQRANENALFQSRMEVLTAEQGAIDAQAAALEGVLASSREWAKIASDIRDSITALQIGSESPLNPAEKLAIVQEKFQQVLAEFWADPSADLARKLADVGHDVIAQGLQVYSQPSPEYRAIFDNIIASLTEVAAFADTKVIPESDTIAQLQDLNAKSLDVKARIDALNVEHAAKLDAITAEEQASLAVLQQSFSPIAQALAGVSSAVWGAGQGVWEQVQAGSGAVVGAIWQTAQALYQQMYATTQQITELTKGAPIDQYMLALTNSMAHDLAELNGSIQDKLRSVIGTRIDALIAQGGTQAVINALQGPMDRTAENTRLTVGWLESLVRGSFRGDVPYRSFQEGTWASPGGPAILHPGEVVVPAAVSAAEWVRQGGFSVAGGTRSAPTSVTFAPTVHATGDARTIAREMQREFEVWLRDHGIALPRRR